LFQIDLAQDRYKRTVFPERHAVGGREFNDPIGDLAFALGRHAWCALAVPLQADCYGQGRGVSLMSYLRIDQRLVARMDGPGGVDFAHHAGGDIKALGEQGGV